MPPSARCVDSRGCGEHTGTPLVSVGPHEGAAVASWPWLWPWPWIREEPGRHRWPLGWTPDVHGAELLPGQKSSLRGPGLRCSSNLPAKWRCGTMVLGAGECEPVWWPQEELDSGAQGGALGFSAEQASFLESAIDHRLGSMPTETVSMEARWLMRTRGEAWPYPH